MTVAFHGTLKLFALRTLSEWLNHDDSGIVHPRIIFTWQLLLSVFLDSHMFSTKNTEHMPSGIATMVDFYVCRFLFHFYFCFIRLICTSCNEQFLRIRTTVIGLWWIGKLTLETFCWKIAFKYNNKISILYIDWKIHKIPTPLQSADNDNDTQRLERKKKHWKVFFEKNEALCNSIYFDCFLVLASKSMIYQKKLASRFLSDVAFLSNRSETGRFIEIWELDNIP